MVIGLGSFHLKSLCYEGGGLGPYDAGTSITKVIIVKVLQKCMSFSLHSSFHIMVNRAINIICTLYVIVSTSICLQLYLQM